MCCSALLSGLRFKLVTGNVPSVSGLSVPGFVPPCKLRNRARVDAVLLLKTYHEVAQPIVLFRNLRKSLAKEAKVGVIDRNGNGTDHGVGRDVVVREMKEAGYKLVRQEDFVKDGMDYFLVFAAE